MGISLFLYLKFKFTPYSKGYCEFKPYQKVFHKLLSISPVDGGCPQKSMGFQLKNPVVVRVAGPSDPVPPLRVLRGPRNTRFKINKITLNI